MEAAAREYCPTCNHPYDEIWSDGRCAVCDTDLVEARTNPHAQQRMARARKRDEEHRLFFELVRKCREWGLANGHPAASDYPQYLQLRRFGYYFKENGGFDRMGRALKLLADEMGEDDGRSWARFVEFAWKDIGGWAP